MEASFGGRPILLPSAYFCGVNFDRDRILLAELLRRHVQSGNSLAIFFKVLRNFMRGSMIHINESLACKNDDLPVSGFIGIEMQSDLWVVLNVRDFISPCLTEDQERIILPEEPDRSWLRRESRIDSGQPDHILILKMLLYGTAKIRLKVDHLQAAGFIRSATSSATSFTCTVPPSAREASLSIVMQNGQPTASVFALVSFTSLKRASLTRSVPGSSSF